MDIELWKARKKELKLTFDALAQQSGVSRRQLIYLFNGDAKNAGVETVERIERALGIDAPAPTDAPITDEQRELLALLQQMTEDEILELSNYVDFIISKRK